MFLKAFICFWFICCQNRVKAGIKKKVIKIETFFFTGDSRLVGWYRVCWSSVLCLGSGNCTAGGAAAGLGRGDPGWGSCSAMGEALVPWSSSGSYHRDLLVSRVYSMLGWVLEHAIPEWFHLGFFHFSFGCLLLKIDAWIVNEVTCKDKRRIYSNVATENLLWKVQFPWKLEKLFIFMFHS